MNSITGMHEPTPEFRAHLDWEVARAIRGEQPRKWRRPEGRLRGLRAAAVILVAVMMGAMAATLPAQVRNDRQRDTLLAAKQAELQLATTRLQIARSEFEDVRRRADVGLVGREALATAQAELQRMASQLSRVQLDLQEIRASAKPPRDDLPAPLVDGQDFVRARLEQALLAALKLLSAAEPETAEITRRALVGAAPRLRVLEAQAELARQQAEMQRVAGELELRKRFLARELKPGEVALEAQRLQLESELRVVQKQRELMDERLAEVKAAAKAGAIEQVELLRAQLAAAEQAAALERARRELEALPKSEP
jgi:hypothetical protein